MADISGFYNRIQDYIYISPTGETSSGGYDIYQYSQNDAKLYGGEAGISLLPVGWIEASANYSYLIGKQDNGSYLPFIPANKFRIELKLKKKRIDFLNNPYFKIGGLYACKQSNPSDFETETDDYFILNAGAGAEIKWDNQFIFLSVQANNLLNEMYIDHLSTLKSMGYHNIGRNISINMKVPFSVK
jgi:iron complex outermembrane receptor protein